MGILQNFEAIFWIIAMIVFGIMEAVTAGVVSVWFVVGSILPLILAILGVSIWIQIIAFMVVSILCILLLRPLSEKLASKNSKENMLGDTKLEQGPIGKTCKVTERISNIDCTGAVYIDGKTWTARIDESCDYDHINKDELVEVVNVSGVKLLVKIK